MTTRTPPTTPEQIEAAAKAKAIELQELQDRQAAIAQAHTDTRRATEMREYHAHRAQAEQYRTHRNELADKLTALANQETLSLNDLFDTFTRLKAADVACGALATHLSALNTVDPMPRNAIGVQRQWLPVVSELYAGATWSGSLDNIVTKHADTARAKHLNELRNHVTTAVDAAVTKARTDAANLPAGQRLPVDTPRTICEQHAEAVAAITDDDLNPDTVKAASFDGAHTIAADNALKKLTHL